VDSEYQHFLLLHSWKGNYLDGYTYCNLSCTFEVGNVKGVALANSSSSNQ